MLSYTIIAVVELDKAQQQTLFPHWLAYVSTGLTLSYLLAGFWAVLCQDWRAGMEWSLDFFLGSGNHDSAERLYHLVLLV